MGENELQVLRLGEVLVERGESPSLQRMEKGRVHICGGQVGRSYSQASHGREGIPDPLGITESSYASIP